MLLFLALVVLLYSEHFAFRISGIFQKKNVSVVHVCMHVQEQIFIISRMSPSKTELKKNSQAVRTQLNW